LTSGANATGLPSPGAALPTKTTTAASSKKKSRTVRKIVGYFRCQGTAGATVLQAVYDAYNPLLNLYYPRMKQIRCGRVGAKKKRTYGQAKTPFQRLLKQPFEDRLEERRVKMAALALKDTTALVERN
jgi:hypothetical protein